MNFNPWQGIIIILMSELNKKNFLAKIKSGKLEIVHLKEKPDVGPIFIWLVNLKNMSFFKFVSVREGKTEPNRKRKKI